MKWFAPRCYNCRQRLGAEYTTVVVSARCVVDLCVACADLYRRDLITVCGLHNPDAETVNSPALAARRWNELQP